MARACVSVSGGVFIGRMGSRLCQRLPVALVCTHALFIAHQTISIFTQSWFGYSALVAVIGCVVSAFSPGQLMTSVSYSCEHQ